MGKNNNWRNLEGSQSFPFIGLARNVYAIFFFGTRHYNEMSSRLDNPLCHLSVRNILTYVVYPVGKFPSKTLENGVQGR